MLYEITIRTATGRILINQVQGPNPDDALARLADRDDYMPDVRGDVVQLIRRITDRPIGAKPK